MKYIHEAYGDPLRVLKERIRAIDSTKALPPLRRKEARVTWFLEFESILKDVIQLGGDDLGKRNYCTAYSEFTVEKVLSAFPEEGEDVSLRAQLCTVVGDGRELFENMKAKVSKFRQNAQAFVGSSDGGKKMLGQIFRVIQLARHSPKFLGWILARYVPWLAVTPTSRQQSLYMNHMWETIQLTVLFSSASPMPTGRLLLFN